LDADGFFSEEDARKIFVQILEALSYCHTHQIAHRDLKPENFLFLNKNSLDLKLIDFGLAYRWKESMRGELAAKGEKKLVGTVKISITQSYYIAPEIISGSYDQRCDIWSAGVILYILLTAVPPFDGDSDKAIIEQVRKLKYDINSILHIIQFLR
jgi:calcium-dependent protein kinase